MKDRIISIDILRGLTVLMMTIVNNPGSWSFVFPPLLHAQWNGCTPTDLVFPFFVFLMGAAIPLAIPYKKFDSEILEKIFTRSLRIICLGMFLNFFSNIEFFNLTGTPLLLIRLVLTFIVGYALMGNFSAKVKLILAIFIFLSLITFAYSGLEAFAYVRLPGVLQRIGIVYFFATIIYLRTSIKTQLIFIAIFLLGYWALIALVPVPGIGFSNLEPKTNLAAWVDSLLLKNHMYIETKTWDPEGILSTLPVIANGLLGVLVGQLLISTSFTKIKITQIMAIASVSLIFIGLIWDVVFPINKSIWTSSYVLFTSGIALFILAIIYYLVDVLNYKNWTKFFLIWGVNPMIVFFLSGILPRAFAMINVQNPIDSSSEINIRDYAYTFWISANFENQYLASLLYAIIYALLWSLLLWYFYKNKIFFKV